MDLVTYRSKITDASVYTNPKTSNRSVMLRLEVPELQDPRQTGFLPLTATIIGGKSRYAGQSAERRTRTLLAAAVPAAVQQDGSLSLDALEGAEILATFSPDGDLVSVANRGPRSI